MYLNCHSFHSLRYGTIAVEDLVKEAYRLGIEALALTDVNATPGIYDFIKECEHYGIKPLVGIDFRNNHRQQYVGLAQNSAGFQQLTMLMTKHNYEDTPLPKSAPELDHVFIVYPISNIPDRPLRPYEYVGISQQQLSFLYKCPIPRHRLVIMQTVTYANAMQHDLHRVLRAVDNNVLLTRLPPDQMAMEGSVMLPIDSLLEQFVDHPYLVTNTMELIDHCNFSFDFEVPKNKKTYTNSKYNDKILLEQLAYEGMEKRYGKHNKVARERIARELEVIDQMSFSGYFLITWDIIRYSMQRGFYHVGRGSGANSIVSYCLYITNCCPLELNLYFERFLNPKRTSPPDFDIDWSWQDRDTILSYIFKRFNSECIAFCGTIGKFKHRSIVRELGKVFGLSKEQLDELSDNPMDARSNDSQVRKIHHYGKVLEGYPNMRSLHACGILISEHPLTQYSVLEMPPKGFPTVQFDMYIAEDINFEKLDILSQRGIGHIKDCVELIRENKNEKVDIHETQSFKKDPELNKLLSVGNTIGCFYIESPAMRGLLRKLRCSDYETLVAASSIIRPGVAQSGMNQEYQYRHNNPGKFEYFHPVFKEQLGDTYGIMVYQEDVLKIAHHFGGLDLSEADVLRRAISGKTRSRKQLQKIKDTFFANCRERGYKEQLITEVYRQIESFAGYSFCKAHSASYAVESYQSLFLKTYYPLEFMVAVINNFGGFYRTEVYVHEARMAGAIIENPCVNNSDLLTTIKDDMVYLGFGLLQNLNTGVAEAITAERGRNGDFTSFEDFIARVKIGIENIQILIFIGAFRFCGRSKNELILRAKLLVSLVKREQGTAELFAPTAKTYQLPELQRSIFEDAYDEIELLGFPTSCSPFDMLQVKSRGNVTVRTLNQHIGKVVKIVAYLISRKHNPTKYGPMNFGTWIDCEGQMFDTTHFAECLRRYPFTGGGCYVIMGTVDEDYGFTSILVDKIARLPFVPDPRYPNEKVLYDKTIERIKEDQSLTWRKPYPTAQEINLPRHKMR